MTPEVDVLVVGAGPGGLAAATEARRQGAGRVVVLDREVQAGGIPRHCVHTGFGWLALRNLVDGPELARALVARAREAGVDVRPETSALGWSGAREVRVTGPNGVGAIAARAVVLATGCRERPRAARLVAGTRPPGVFTTGSLQQWVHHHGQCAGQRAVVVGAELVSYSAALALRQSGTDVVALVTEQPRHQAPAGAGDIVNLLLGLPVVTGVRVVRLEGQGRLRAVVVRDAGGQERALACDAVVFTGDWIPEQELAIAGDVELDQATRGPRVDLAFRTSRAGVFAVGNLVRGAETADRVWQEGVRAGAAVAAFLRDGAWPAARIPFSAAAPLGWVAPSALGVDLPVYPALGRPCFTLRVQEFTHAALLVRQGNRELFRTRRHQLVPNRRITLGSQWLDRVDARAGPVSVQAG